MQDVAQRLIASRRRWPEPPAPGWDRRYKARSGPRFEPAYPFYGWNESALSWRTHFAALPLVAFRDFPLWSQRDATTPRRCKQLQSVQRSFERATRVCASATFTDVPGICGA